MKAGTRFHKGRNEKKCNFARYNNLKRDIMNSLSKKFIMYYKIKKLSADKLSISQICERLEINWRTVNKYLKMTESEYLEFIAKQATRTRELEPYTDFICNRLKEYPQTSAAQIHDLLKERFSNFSEVSPKTIYNFTIWVRQNFNLPKTPHTRQFHAVDELDYGVQAQVDFGEYNIVNQQGNRQKVWFFCMSLSRSRYKFVVFSQVHFTTQTTIEAHDKGFCFFEGIPKTVVYDQDRLLLVDENRGEYILTETFKKYTDVRKFQLHFCRKADPQSKGKIENNVKYVKQNFLYGRVFTDIQTLNKEAISWLNRTANALPHSTTQKVPQAEWILEKSHLAPYTRIVLPQTELPLYSVRKDNTINFKGNFYSVPFDTYNGRGTQVKLEQSEEQIIIFSLQHIEIARHQIASTKGNKISNSNHKRDGSNSIEQLLNLVAAFFSQPQIAKTWLNEIRTKFPRHVRDHLLLMKSEVTINEIIIIDVALDFCVQNKLYSASDFKDVVLKEKSKIKSINTDAQPIKPLVRHQTDASLLIPEASNIEVYQTLMN